MIYRQPQPQPRHRPRRRGAGPTGYAARRPIRRAARYAALCLVLCAAPVGAQYALDYETWARPRSAAAVLAMPAVERLMRDWLRAAPGSRVEIRYPGGAEGSLWAGELRDWLVALGLPAARIDTVSGSRRGGQLELAIRTARH